MRYMLFGLVMIMTGCSGGGGGSNPDVASDTATTQALVMDKAAWDRAVWK